MGEGTVDDHVILIRGMRAEKHSIPTWVMLENEGNLSWSNLSARRLRDRQCEAKCRPGIGRTLDPDAPLVGFHKPARNRQT